MYYQKLKLFTKKRRISSDHGNFLGNHLRLNVAKVLEDLVEDLDDLIGVLCGDLIGDVVVGLHGLRDGIDEVAEAEVEELVLIEGRHMQVGEHVGQEGQGLVVQGGDVERLHELGVNLVDLGANNRGEQVVVAASDHANLVLGNHNIGHGDAGDVQIEFPARVNGNIGYS